MAAQQIKPSQIDNWFAFHPARPDQIPRYEAIRAAGRAMVETIVRETPQGADQHAAVRKAREAVMTACAAVACHG